MQVLLPSELKHHIVELSSHDSLASLARTHTTFQSEAEQALYSTLSNPSLKCLETLDASPEKAGFVRFLAMGHVDYENDDHHRKQIDYLLSNVLVNLHSLSDFRLRMPPSDSDVQPWIECLINKILWSVYGLGIFNILKTNCS